MAREWEIDTERRIDTVALDPDDGATQLRHTVYSGTVIAGSGIAASGAELFSGDHDPTRFYVALSLEVFEDGEPYRLSYTIHALAPLTSVAA